MQFNIISDYNAYIIERSENEATATCALVSTDRYNKVDRSIR